MRHCVRVVFVVILLAGVGVSAGEPGSEEKDKKDKKDKKKGPGVIHRILTYVPCRIVDVFDVVRLRARVGPGIGFGIRATEAADLFIGGYYTIYVGLPGPRCRKTPRLPIGVETRTGVEVSVADASTGLLFGPAYSDTEFGLGFQALLVGPDIGFDLVEVIDLALGLFFIDIRGDDF